jgi:hypothetical protein
VSETLNIHVGRMPPALSRLSPDFAGEKRLRWILRARTLPQKTALSERILGRLQR